MCLLPGCPRVPEPSSLLATCWECPVVIPYRLILGNLHVGVHSMPLSDAASPGVVSVSSCLGPRSSDVVSSGLRVCRVPLQGHLPETHMELAWVSPRATLSHTQEQVSGQLCAVSFSGSMLFPTGLQESPFPLVLYCEGMGYTYGHPRKYLIKAVVLGRDVRGWVASLSNSNELPTSCHMMPLAGLRGL